MTFLRTPSGLAALHVFFNVDKILYCEGKPSLEKDTGSSLPKSLITHDTMFWSYVISLLKVKKKFHVKSLGSKSDVIAQLEACRRENVTTAVFAVDSDYEHFLPNPLMATHKPLLIGTFGYSWESDVVHRRVVLLIMEHLLGPLDSKTKREINIEISIIEKQLHKWSNIDLAFFISTQIGIFEKSAPMRQVLKDNVKPSLNENFLKNSLRARQQEIQKIIIPRHKYFKKQESLRYSFGKLTSRLFYHFVLWYANQKNAQVRNFPYDAFMRLAISFTFSSNTSRLRVLKKFYGASSTVFA
jgi:hypothetical protein